MVILKISDIRVMENDYGLGVALVEVWRLTGVVIAMLYFPVFTTIAIA